MFTYNPVTNVVAEHMSGKRKIVLSVVEYLIKNVVIPSFIAHLLFHSMSETGKRDTDPPEMEPKLHIKIIHSRKRFASSIEPGCKSLSLNY